jgi:hypothetical protein
MKLLRLLLPLRILAAVAVASALARPTFAQGLPPSGPISLVIAYRAKPADRPALRAVMADAGVAQLERWKVQGVFADYDLFFSILPAPGPTGDLTLILRFSHFTDLANWAKIEQTSAGGLPPAARTLAEPVSTDLADLDWERPPTKGPHPSLYVLFPYVLKTDTGTYRAYTTAKTVPQLDVWIKRGAITGFQMYMCHTESGGTWGSLGLPRKTGHQFRRL